MNWVFWVLVLIALFAFWLTNMNIWEQISKWLEDTINNMKNNDKENH